MYTVSLLYNKHLPNVKAPAAAFCVADAIAMAAVNEEEQNN